MYGISYEIYKTIDPQKMDAVWADNCITTLRRDWVPLVNQVRARENKRLLDSMQDIEYIKNNFKDKKFKREMRWDPIGVMEVFKNILIEDIIKSPPKAELRAEDPTAISDRKDDIMRLRNRKIVEKDINKYQKQTMKGMPAYKYTNFKGNVSDFDKLGLDENDPEDLTFYELDWQRLNYEIAGQSLLNIVFKLCRFDLDLTYKAVRDILSCRATTFQTYVDKLTGEIKARYLYPETFYGIFGDSGDGRNDICNGWNDNVSINEWLQMVGNEFDWERDWRKLLWAINYCGNTKYTGFIRNNIRYDCCSNPTWKQEGGLDSMGITQSNLVDWTMAFNYQINCGYIEWKVEEATSTFLKNTNYPSFVDVVPYNIQLTEKQKVEGYYKKSNYQQQTYGSYFISTTSVSQWIFGFGKVYHQTLEGANDEYSCGTMKYYILPGKSAIEIARPYIRMANEAFYKMLWAIDKAKPQEDVYIYEELVRIAQTVKKMYPQTANEKMPGLDTILRDVIQWQRENFIHLRAYPFVDGKPILQLPPLEGKKNGIDPVYVALESVLTWAEMQIGAKIGVNPMRTGMNPPPRESEKTEMNTIENSMNATNYIYHMVQFTKSRIGTDIINYAQNIIRFKDSVPYKWLKRVVGQEDFAAFNLIDDIAAHRFGLLVNDYNVDMLKQRVLAAADLALKEKSIELDQWGMIIQSEDPKKAMKLLAIYRRKKEKRERKQTLEEMKIKDEMDQAAHQRRMEELTTKINGEIKKAQIEADGLIKSAQIQSQGRIEVKEIAVNAEGQKQADKAEATQEINTSKEKDKESKPFPAVAGA